MQYRNSLKGLPGVQVVVEDFNSAAEGAGFNGLTFQTDVELKLRMVGITAIEVKGFPVLYLNVKTLNPERDQNRAYSASLELFQRVLIESQLRSDPENSSEEASAPATTWSTDSLGIGSVAHVRDTVRDMVDMFINDWLAVNPRSGTAPVST